MALRELPALPEPVGLRAELGELAASDPAAARAALPRALEAHAASHWTTEDRRALDAAAASAQRELWLWLMGERTWSQIAGNLAGRVLRRQPAA